MTTQELHGIEHELKFWQGFVKTPRFLNGWVADCVTPELNAEVRNFIYDVYNSHPEKKDFQVLDVGSGVVSILNGLIPKENLTTVDPLGGLYEIIFDYKKHRIKSPLPYPAEEMPFKDQYDLVHCSNALDHCQNPMIAYLKLKQAVKPGGYLILQGFENEANYENWQGFHQWNIELKDDGLCITGKDGHSQTIVNPFHAVRTIFENNKSWFIFITQK